MNVEPNPLVARVLIALTRRRVPVLARLLGVVCNCDFTLRFVGEGLGLPHPYGIVIHDRALIGVGCSVMQHVTIGSSPGRAGVPVIGDDVLIGAGAVILGAVTIGSGARIGANSVVLADVPAGATAVGVPARLVSPARPLS